MTENRDYDDIRPYDDEEIPAAMHRIAGSIAFPLLASYIFPEMDVSDVKEKIMSIRTVDQFQAEVMLYMNKRVIAETITEFSFGGVEHLLHDTAYLFISNHRDIVLDSSLMQYVLYNNGFATSEITFGANLMQSQLIVDIGKANKMFKVERPGGDMRKFYRSSSRLSAYIHYTIG